MGLFYLSNMAKLRIQGRYGVTPHTILYSKEISLKAKGLYGYMQSKPDGWEFSADRIVLECKESRDAIQAALRELESAGLLIRNKFQEANGHWEWEHILMESPSQENPASEDTPLEMAATNKEVDSKKDLVINTSFSENEFSQEEITDSTCIEKEEDSFAVPEEEYAPRKKSPAPSSPLIVWAEQRIGRKFVSPLKQRRCIITLKGAGYDDEDIKSMWMDLEADEYWANIGIDFGIVLSQADKRSTRVDTKKIKQQYDDHMKEFHRMLAEDLPRDQIQKYVDEFIKPLRAKYGFR